MLKFINILSAHICPKNNDLFSKEQQLVPFASKLHYDECETQSSKVVRSNSLEGLQREPERCF